MEHKFSIITVNYNDKKGLQKTIDSVVHQNFKDFEFIIVDGDSTDGSKVVIENHAAHFSKWISEPDNGIYHAMNKGIKMATGTYLLFLNSGDSLIDDEVLEKLDKEIDGSVDLYYGDILFEEANQTKKITSPEKLSFDFFFTGNLPHQACFIRRTLFTEIFFYDEGFKIVSDWEFLTYAICKVNISYKHLPILVSLYDGTGISSDSNNYKVMYAERDIAINKHFPAFKHDYEKISLLKQRRVKHFLEIKKHPIPWKILRSVMSLLLLFIPKIENKQS